MPYPIPVIDLTQQQTCNSHQIMRNVLSSQTLAEQQNLHCQSDDILEF